MSRLTRSKRPRPSLANGAEVNLEADIPLLNGAELVANDRDGRIAAITGTLKLAGQATNIHQSCKRERVWEQRRKRAFFLL